MSTLQSVRAWVVAIWRSLRLRPVPCVLAQISCLTACPLHLLEVRQPQAADPVRLSLACPDEARDSRGALGRNRTEPVADLPDAPMADDGPEHRLLACELGERLGELLDILTPRQREVLVLRIAVGLSAEETAATVHSTPGAVRVTQHRALNRLRVALGHGADDLVTPASGAAAGVG